MTIQDLGSMGELIAAIATLVYFAAQVGQNTRALRSSPFQDISGQMAENIEAIVTSPHIAELFVKIYAPEGSDLTPTERFQINSTLVMTFRRLDAVFVQG